MFSSSIPPSSLFSVISNHLVEFFSCTQLKKTLPKRFMKHVLVGENVRTSKLMDCKSKLSLQGNYEELGQ